MFPYHHSHFISALFSDNAHAPPLSSPANNFTPL
jgi:hypothetical protein